MELSTEHDRAKVLYYGDPGVGKSSHLAAVARLGKVIYIDIEAGLKAQALMNLGIPISNIDVRRLKTFEEVDKFRWDIMSMASKELPFAIVWDSITEGQQTLLEIDLSRKAEQALRLKGISLDQFTYGIDDRGRNSDQTLRLARAFRDMPCHIGIAALQREDKDEKSGRLAIGPSLSPKAAGLIMGYMDVVIRAYVDVIDGQVVYLGQTKPGKIYKAKDRYGLLPPIMVNPTFDRVIAYINGEMKAADDPEQTLLELLKKGA